MNIEARREVILTLTMDEADELRELLREEATSQDGSGVAESIFDLLSEAIDK